MKKDIIKTDKDYITKRLSVIAGQVNGVKQMVENNRNSYDTLVQIAAINNSLKRISYSIIKKEIENNPNKNLDDLMELIKIIK